MIYYTQNQTPEIGTPETIIPIAGDGNREALGLFDDMNNLQAAIRALETTAFPRDAISILGHRQMIEKDFGTAQIQPYLAESDPSAPRAAPVRDEEHTIGATVLVGCGTYIGAVAAGIALAPASVPVTLMAIILAGGSGAAIAGALVQQLKRRHDKNIHEQVAQGGLLMWVHTPDAERERLACDILEQFGAHDVHVQDIPTFHTEDRRNQH